MESEKNPSDILEKALNEEPALTAIDENTQPDQTVSDVEISTDKPSKKRRKRGPNKITVNKGFSCGWCKFHAQFSKTVVRHHYARHPKKELDVIKEKKDHTVDNKADINTHQKQQEQDSNSPVQFNCKDCSFTSPLRRKVNVHSKLCHGDSSDKGGITDYDSDGPNSPIFPRSYYNFKNKNTFDDHQREFKLKDLKIQCRDFFQTGIDKLQEVLTDYGVSKVCVDSLPEFDFISMAVHYKSAVTYVEKNGNPNDAIKLNRFNDSEIWKLISDFQE